MKGSPTVHTKSPDHHLIKKLLLVSTDQDRTRQAHHQKANTQNINIYNIIHNGNNNQISKIPQMGQDPRIYITTNFEKTYDQPLRLVKDKHQLMLEQELKNYKAEVEMKYQNSAVNQTYAFPRTSLTIAECSNKASIVNEENIPVSIYDGLPGTDSSILPRKKRAIIEDSKLNTIQKPQQKSYSQDKKKPEPTHKRKLHEGFNELLQKLLKGNNAKQNATKKPSPKNSKVSLRSTRRLELGEDSAPAPVAPTIPPAIGASKKQYGADVMQSYFGKTLQAHELKLYRYNSKNKADIPRLDYPTKEQLPSLALSETFSIVGRSQPQQEKRAHSKTHAVIPEDTKNLRKIVYMKKLTESINDEGRTRTGMKAMQLSGYFADRQTLTNPTNVKAKKALAKSIHNIQYVKAKRYNNTKPLSMLSLSTCINNNTSQGVLKAREKDNNAGNEHNK